MAEIDAEDFGVLADGAAVKAYTLRNAAGMQLVILSYGAIIQSLTCPDRHGRYADVVLGYGTLAEYVRSSSYLGAIVGRYANRIAQARFMLDGSTYHLTKNDGSNTLHGGFQGLDRLNWHVIDLPADARREQLTLRCCSPHGDQGFPGKLEVAAVYSLSDDNAVRLELTATTDQATVINLTNHAYFNLRARGDVLSHEVQILADRFLPVDAALIPIGERRAVAGTPFDFRDARPVGYRIQEPDEQLRLAHGYDHNWVVADASGDLRLQARVRDVESGRVLQVSSTEPGVQFYSGNSLDGSSVGKLGQCYDVHSGLTFEPQKFPDAPNQPGFPSAVLRPGEVYRHLIVYQFLTE